METDEYMESARAQRAEERGLRITAHTASDWKDAEEWDLEFWQRQGPEGRLSALVALRNDLAAVRGKDANLDWED